MRLDRDQLSGTLMLAEVDNLENVSLLLGPDGADRVLRRAAVLLQGTVRPTDLGDVRGTRSSRSGSTTPII